MTRRITAGSAGGAPVAGLQAFTTTLTSAEDLDIIIDPIGVGRFLVDGPTQIQSQNPLRFADADSSNWVAFRSPATVGNNITWTLPSADGSSNQVLTTNGSGDLAWTTKEITVTNDTSGSAQFNVALTSASSGNIAGITTTNTKLQFQPSTGTLSVSELTVNGTARYLRTENGKTASYILELVDRNRVVAFTGSSPQTVTIPPDSSVNFPIGSVVYIGRFGSGTLTLAGGSGVTVTRTGSFSQSEEIYVRKRASNSWVTVDSPQRASGGGGTISSTDGFTVHSFTSGSGTFTLS